MTERRRFRGVAVAAVVALALAPAACSSGKEESAEPAAPKQAKSGKITIAYIQKVAGSLYFQQEVKGAKEKAKELGDVEIKTTNVELDATRAIDAMNNSITQKVDGIVIVVPDQKIGPQVIDMAKNANVPLLASADPIKSGDGEPAPYVGYDGREMGLVIGKTAGELYQKAGWSASDTRIINIQTVSVDSCVQRGEGSLESFQKVVGTDIPKIIDADAATLTEAQDKASAIVTSNPRVKHWLIWGCADEIVVPSVTALDNAGIDPSNVIGVTIGGYLACKDWRAGKESGNKAALFINGNAVGQLAVQTLVDNIRNGKEMPEKQYPEMEMVDKDTWEAAGLTCT